MKKCIYTVAALLGSLFFHSAIGQNVSPYWSLSGNSNATSSSKLGTTNGIPLRLYTKNAERLRIDTAGRVGIGTISPTELLHLNSATGKNPMRVQVNGATKFFVGSGGGVAIGANTTPPANGLYVAGNVGIGTNVPKAKLHVVGTSLFSDAVTVSEGGITATNTTGIALTSNGYTYGVYASGGNAGVFGEGDDGLYGYSSVRAGVYGQGPYYGVNGYASDGSGKGVSGDGAYGVYGNGTAYGVYGNSTTNYGVYGKSGYLGVFGTGGTYGLYGNSSAGTGVAGISVTDRGVYGQSNSSVGVYGISSSNLGGDFYSSSSWGLRSTTSTGTYAGVFNGTVFSSVGFTTTSDNNLKQNVKEVDDALSLINKLKPRNYEFKTDEKLAFLNLPKGRHYGLMAQDLEEILPNLVTTGVHDVLKPVKQQDAIKANPDESLPARVKEGETPKPETMTIKSVNYIELIPILVKGMQEQTTLIKQQQLQINELKDQVRRLSGNSSTTVTGTLTQSTPNPVSRMARIAYNVPSGAGHAQLLLTDNLGRTVKTVSLSRAGYVNVDVSALSSGIYNYSMVVDGTITDSKKMEVVRR